MLDVILLSLVIALDFILLLLVIALDFILFNIYFLKWNLPFLTFCVYVLLVPFPVMDWRTNLHNCTNICGGPTVHTLVEVLLYTH